jgi:hypothetical protein
MMDFVKEAFEKERVYQEEAEIRCTVTVDGYTDFIFVNRFGECQHQGTLNKAIRRIIRDCNDEVLAKNRTAPYSCRVSAATPCGTRMSSTRQKFLACA